MKSINEQIKIISKGAAEIINLEDLKNKLTKAENENRPLIVKLGLDPSAPDIHLGHAVVLRKMRQIQDLGHKVVIIIGDFTGRIGDPTGKSKTRRQLTGDEVLENAKTYEKQIFKILDIDKTELRFNSEWLAMLNFQQVIELSSKYTVARMLEREDFKNRFVNQLSIGIHEFFYPLMQGFDSVALKADIELGGTDQRFNVLMGRTLQRDYGIEPQVALFMPLLEGIDGIEKMSKSLGNYVSINEEPREMYIKLMKIPDSLIIKYFELATDLHPDEVNAIKEELNKGVNPRDIKMKLASEVTSLYHDKKAAVNAEEYFKSLFKKDELPEDVPEVKAKEDAGLVEIMVTFGLAASNSEARRLIIQGGVKINGNRVIDNKNLILKANDVIQVGKKKFVRISAG